MRTIEQLIDASQHAWPLITRWIEAAKRHVEVLPAEVASAKDALFRTQVSTRSPMGAVIHKTGGILVDSGWLRLLGAGSPRLPRSLPDWNRTALGTTVDSGLPFLLVADDVIGGFFAVDGGGLAGPPGSVFYLAPDTLEWEQIAPTYTDFLCFVFSGDIDKFYEGLRWPGWHTEIQTVSGDEGLSVYPFLWSDGPAIAERSRKPVPISELWALTLEMRHQLERL